MKTVNLKLMFFLLVLFLAYDPYDARLKVVNGSSGVIVVQESLDTIPTYPSENLTEYYLANGVSSRGTVDLFKSGKKRLAVFY